MAKIELIILKMCVLDFDQSLGSKIEALFQTVAGLDSSAASCSKSCLSGLPFEVIRAS